MRYLVNGTLRPERSREDLVAKVRDRTVSDEAWDLVRRGVVTEHWYKIGPRPGFVFIIEGDSADAVKTAVGSLPVVHDGWFDVEIEPLGRFLSDLGS